MQCSAKCCVVVLCCVVLSCLVFVIWHDIPMIFPCHVLLWMDGWINLDLPKFSSSNSVDFGEDRRQENGEASLATDGEAIFRGFEAKPGAAGEDLKDLGH